MRSLVFTAVSCLPAIIAAANPPDLGFDKLWSLENNIWTNFLYPANLKQINATDDSVFTEDVRSKPQPRVPYLCIDTNRNKVQGRVDITRTFPGRELNNEYIFGLFSQPESLSLTGVAINYTITQFVANQNMASATTVITFNSTSFGVLLPLTVDSWMAFNEDGKVTQYDATFRWFDWFVKTLFEAAAVKFNTTDPIVVKSTLTELLAKAICETSDKYCTGDNKQYDSQEQCMQVLTKEKRFGDPYELGRDTLLCREVHKHMVQYRPTEHCPHIGPSGGDMCVDDKSYVQTVLESYFPQSWIANGYGDDNIWVKK
ncbi:unnamed protein product [Aspergillus oryzae]|uniref:DNA, SC003 n=2 Tax=Aspergillus oryzae TaxID=5062 RepID=Q2ULH3_ASPOR|nr:unnamed protein product [Aspergillus oryzae RIB40]BAE57592.1 unnamed protein product [Aspergillus oryzae RIB40]GMF79525.1 unnamed protein product [Aspergillus oryzae]GMF85909.1 unnamed protein product [Aspergillus oryzae]GMG44873.1 unnamed protein product [Aspergillus oryzae var. brunneus]